MLVALHPFRRESPPARIPEATFPDPYFFTDTEHAIVDDIPTLLNKNGLTSHQSPNLLERVGEIIKMERLLAKGTTH